MIKHISISYIINIIILTSLHGQALQGNYTIGGLSPSFENITAAVNAISNYGISGPVVFNIRPGVYQEKISIGSISGSNAANTVTFKSETNDSQSVEITYGSSISPWHVINIVGSSYISFEKITITNTTTNQYGKYGLVVRLENTNNLTFKGCIFNGMINPSEGSGLNAIFYSSTGPNNYLTITNCIFNNGFNAIILSSNSFYSQGVSISDCRFYNSVHNTIHLTKMISLNIKRNYLENYGYRLSKTGILVSWSYSPIEISSNHLYSENDIEIDIFYCGKMNGENLIANNFLINWYGSYALRIYNSTDFNVYHNSIFGYHTDISFMFYCGSENRCNIKNNIFVSEGGIDIYRIISEKPLSSDYNVYHADFGAKMGYVNGQYYDSLSLWKNSTSLDSHSIIRKVFVKHFYDLHLDSNSIGDISLKGASLGVVNDIDGETRNLNAPYVGADENIQFPLPVELTYFSAKKKGQ